ncbi:MAG: MarC family protein [Thermoplasmata archaeon]|nr:MarC family protein [Thermoplasmata archaeon]
MSDLFLGLLIFSALFAIVDPIGMLPFYVALTDGFSPTDRTYVIRRSTVFATGLLVGFAVLGRYVFLLLNFTIYSFEIAGGALLFAIAFDMLFGESPRTKLSPLDREELLSRREEVGIVPLGMPLLAGPGALSTVMIYAQLTYGSLTGTVALYVAIVLVMIVSFVVLRLGVQILGRAGRVGAIAVSRVMGLLLSAIAVQFVINGVVGAFGIHVP